MACRAGFVDSISFNRSSGGVHKWSCWSDLYCAVNKSCFMLINMYAGSGVVNAVNDIVGTLPETIGNLTCANRISKLYVHPTLGVGLFLGYTDTMQRTALHYEGHLREHRLLCE